MLDEDVFRLQLQDLRPTSSDDTPSPWYLSRYFVQSSPNRRVFSSLHHFSLLESRATDELASNLFVWPAMQKELKAWTRACLGCQQNGVLRQNKDPIELSLASL
nr:unnamed protein product [Spirometra erinaceieuropaei]